MLPFPSCVELVYVVFFACTTLACSAPVLSTGHQKNIDCKTFTPVNMFNVFLKLPNEVYEDAEFKKKLGTYTMVCLSLASLFARYLFSRFVSVCNVRSGMIYSRLICHSLLVPDIFCVVSLSCTSLFQLPVLSSRPVVYFVYPTGGG